MAENTTARNNALGDVPIYAQPYTIVYPFLDADGDLVSAATTPDAEVSKNGDTFGDCTNESTEIATNSGVWYLNLTAAEMTADIVAVIAKSATAGMKTTVAVLYPKKLVTVRTGTCADDGSGTGDVVLDSGASAIDDYYNGMVVAVVIDGASNAEVRMIDDYVGSTKTASVTPDFNTAVDNTDTFTIYLPPGMTGLPHIEKIYSDTTIVTSDLAEVDTSDIHSLLTLVRSDTTSLASDLAEGDFSDILSRLTVTNSQLLIVKSDTSDIRSALVVIASDTAHIESDAVRIESDTQSLASDLAEGDFSDILSRLTVTNSQLLIVKSDTSDIRSALVIIASDTAHIESDAVRIESDTQSLASDLAEADFSDIHSLLTLVRSDTTAIEGTVGGGEGDISDILSRLTITNSQLLIVKSDTSDIRSALVIIASDTAAIEAGGGALTATQASQLARIQSDVIMASSDLAEVDTSDIQSLLTKVYSDTTLISGSGGLSVAQDSKLTQIHSDQASQFTVLEQNTSDTESMLVLIRSDTAHIESDAVRIESMDTVIKSDTTHIESDAVRIESDTQSLASDLAEGDFSDILSRLTVTNSQLLIVKSDTSDIKSNLVQIYSDTAAIHTLATKIDSDQASQFVIIEENTSDTESMLVLIRSDTTRIESDTNTLASDLAEADFSDIVSLLTKVYSDTALVETKLAEADTSDILSMLTKVYSDTTLATDAAGEPGQGAPPASASPQDKIRYLYKFMRNKVVTTPSDVTVYADDTTTTDQRATQADTGTAYTRGEFGTGA